jgi:hypothetical protein
MPLNQACVCTEKACENTAALELNVLYANFGRFLLPRGGLPLVGFSESWTVREH